MYVKLFFNETSLASPSLKWVDLATAYKNEKNWLRGPQVEVDKSLVTRGPGEFKEDQTFTVVNPDTVDFDFDLHAEVGASEGATRMHMEYTCVEKGKEGRYSEQLTVVVFATAKVHPFQSEAD